MFGMPENSMKWDSLIPGSSRGSREPTVRPIEEMHQKKEVLTTSTRLRKLPLCFGNPRIQNVIATSVMCLFAIKNTVSLRQFLTPVYKAITINL